MHILTFTRDANPAITLSDADIEQSSQLAEVLIPRPEQHQDLVGICDRKRGFGHQLPVNVI